MDSIWWMTHRNRCRMIEARRIRNNLHQRRFAWNLLQLPKFSQSQQIAV